MKFKIGDEVVLNDICVYITLIGYKGFISNIDEKYIYVSFSKETIDEIYKSEIGLPDYTPWPCIEEEVDLVV